MSFTVNPKAAPTKQARGRGRGTTERIRGGSVINRGNRNATRPSVLTTAGATRPSLTSTFSSSDDRAKISRSRDNTAYSENSLSLGRAPGFNRLPSVSSLSTATRPSQRTGVSPSRNIRARGGRATGTTTSVRGRGPVNMYDDEHDPVNQDPNNRGNPSDNAQDNRIQHATGYTVVSPDEKKRRQLTEQAQRNMKAYEDHKQQSKLQHVSYVGTVGGGLMSEEEARHKAAINQSQAAFNSRVKRESVRAARKQEENELYDQKKQAARKQAELNEERRKRENERRQAAMRDDMRRKNAAFLDRLQANNVNQENSDSRTIASVIQSKSTPKASFSAKTEITSKKPLSHSPAAISMATSSSEVMSFGHDELDLNQLQVMFPDYSRNYLKEILCQTGSLEAAVDILGGFD